MQTILKWIYPWIVLLRLFSQQHCAAPLWAHLNTVLETNTFKTGRPHCSLVDLKTLRTRFELLCHRDWGHASNSDDIKMLREQIEGAIKVGLLETTSVALFDLLFLVRMDATRASRSVVVSIVFKNVARHARDMCGVGMGWGGAG